MRELIFWHIANYQNCLQDITAHSLGDIIEILTREICSLLDAAGTKIGASGQTPKVT